MVAGQQSVLYLAPELDDSACHILHTPSYQARVKAYAMLDGQGRLPSEQELLVHMLQAHVNVLFSPTTRIWCGSLS